ncbi:hypothetical protein EZV76_10810 [Flagellimonas alvinocaridis]|uniref:Uncharacterized protein n=1 Tax=Flagellimonas alvinocaridis TaxID=2530200 RepID=A0A4S8RLE1_9FLAO|nr:hypothetical protein [Allomuricauda alvinocaridis]THV59308.1 hypothetical protein EZV76_10810 [Allomuricauda alvinocaridis]
MKKIFLTLVFISLITKYSFSQDVYDTMSNQICKCIGSNGAENVDQMMPCIEDAMLKNVEALKAENGVESITEIDTDLMGNKVGARLLKTCDYALKVFANQQKEEKKIVAKQHNLTCEHLKSGDFYYLNQSSSDASTPDTTHVTISNNMFLERMNNGRTYSLLNIEWKSDCKFELEFKESNDPLKKELSQPGDKYLYEVMTNGPESIVVKVFWQKEEFQVELFKSK